MVYPVEKSRERCASNSLSRDNETFLLTAAFYTTISSFWVRPYSREGNKVAVVLVTWWDPNIYWWHSFWFVDWSTLDPLFSQKLLMGFYSENKYLVIESK